MDVPRLSTLQALMLILKAREAVPKRGYYYRSWMSIVQCVQMAKDLGLDEHYFDHKAGRPCGSNPSECHLKNRIWQTIFVCEVMIGSPQGRCKSPLQCWYSLIRQAALTLPWKSNRLTSASRDRWQMAMSPSITYLGISHTSLEWSGTSGD